jgi:hypothetical protein
MPEMLPASSKRAPPRSPPRRHFSRAPKPRGPKDRPLLRLEQHATWRVRMRIWCNTMKSALLGAAHLPREPQTYRVIQHPRLPDFKCLHLAHLVARGCRAATESHRRSEPIDSRIWTDPRAARNRHRTPAKSLCHRLDHATLLINQSRTDATGRARMAAIENTWPNLVPHIAHGEDEPARG